MRCILIAGIMFFSVSAFAGDWNSDPNNYNNSKYNYDNSEYNYKNSPYNYNNSEYNPNRQSICDENGKSVGYVVPKDDGGSNLFNNNGERIGYTPSKW